MLSKCFNPACSTRFLYLHAGKLFRFLKAPDPAPEEEMPGKKPPRGLEFFWLCEECAGRFTLEEDGQDRARLMALNRRSTGTAASS